MPRRRVKVNWWYSTAVTTNRCWWSRVHQLEPEETWRKHYAEINEFERMLADDGAIILKFFLHIDKDEQKKRLLERLEDPAKNWKFSSSDLPERKLWVDYMKAYEEGPQRDQYGLRPLVFGAIQQQLVPQPGGGQRDCGGHAEAGYALSRPHPGSDPISQSFGSRIMALDRFGRRIHYLRIGLTDHCDMRCIYCMPEDVTFRPGGS